MIYDAKILINSNIQYINAKKTCFAKRKTTLISLKCDFSDFIATVYSVSHSVNIQNVLNMVVRLQPFSLFAATLSDQRRLDKHKNLNKSRMLYLICLFL